MKLIQVVDGHDQPVGAATKHPYPGRLDVSVGGYGDEGENYLTAARRETTEETGISDAITLTEIDYYQQSKIDDAGRKLNRFYKIFQTTTSSSTPIIHDPAEANEIRWFSPDEIREFLADPSTKMTHLLRQVLENHYLKK